MFDIESISKTRDIFINNSKDEWIIFTKNFDKSIGYSAQKLLNFINSRHFESTYKYSGIDFDDFQRALSIILDNYDKIYRISSTYDWHYVCENLNKCAYLVFLWTLWDYKTRDEKIRNIFSIAKEGNKNAQNILSIPGVCEWSDWSYVLDINNPDYCSSIFKLFTDIIKKIQYPKKLTDINKSYAISVIKNKISGFFTCEQVNILACYAYNNKLEGNLFSHDNYISNGRHVSRNSVVYQFGREVSWFNPPKPSDRKIQLFGNFNIDCYN